MPVLEDLATKIKNKGLGIETITQDGDNQYTVLSEALTISEEIVKLMEIYDISLVDAITVGVKVIASSNLDNSLSNTLEEEN